MASWTNATTHVESSRTLPPDFPRPATSRPGGVLLPAIAQRFVTVERPAAHAALDPWIERYWTVRWELPDGAAFDSAVLTHPSVHATVESGHGPRHGFPMPAGLVHGVVTRRFSVRLEGDGRVFGVKFRPGGFRGLTGVDADGLTDRIVRLSDVYGAPAATFERDILAARADVERVQIANEFLLERLPPPDRRYEELLAIVAGMVADRALTSVEQVADRFAVTPRTMQRLFRRYVGVGPKWVLQRFRLLDAARLLDQGQASDLSELAEELGWYDQSHFTRDFADVVGVPPGAYAAASRSSQ